MAKTTEPKTAPRDYVVLKYVKPSEYWSAGTHTATSAGRAIDAARDGSGGRWVAVPIHNWNEEDLEVVQRDPTVTRKRVIPGQTEIEMPTEVVAA